MWTIVDYFFKIPYIKISHRYRVDHTWAQAMTKYKSLPFIPEQYTIKDSGNILFYARISACQLTMPWPSVCYYLHNGVWFCGWWHTTIKLECTINTARLCYVRAPLSWLCKSHSDLSIVVGLFSCERSIAYLGSSQADSHPWEAEAPP